MFVRDIRQAVTGSPIANFPNGDDMAGNLRIIIQPSAEQRDVRIVGAHGSLSEANCRENRNVVAGVITRTFHAPSWNIPFHVPSCFLATPGCWRIIESDLHAGSVYSVPRYLARTRRSSGGRPSCPCS